MLIHLCTDDFLPFDRSQNLQKDGKGFNERESMDEKLLFGKGSQWKMKATSRSNCCQ